MEESNRGVLKFSQLSTSIEPGFWYKLSELKLEVDKLDEYERKIWGSYKKIGGKSLFEVGLSSFNNTISIPENSYNTSIAKGYCINKNTLETYKSCDKSELACQYGELLKSQMRNGDVLDDPSLMSSFILLTHADLKKYNFLYWFAFLVPQDITVRFVESSPLGAQLTSESIEQLFGGHSQLTIINRSFFAVVKSGNEIKVYTLKEFSSIFTTIDDEKCSYYFGFCDCSSGDSKQPSWYLRNFLAFIQLHFSNKCRLINVICLREKETSNLLQLEVEGDNRLEKWIGWKRKSDGKFGPISVCLGESMDPVRLAENGRRLNLSLMKWRLAPLLDVGVVRSSSFLLLGAGTLGCSVALNLTAWGAERITFVDSGRVSYSNPGRQFLFTFEDSSGRPAALKAQAAANRLKAICPNMIARGEVLEIAMPGHSGCCDSSEQLSTLIGQHDVIFLLTDTRESRWLPTLLARHHNKIAITAALGFDSYLVMRHGSHLADKPLGCYFCNDVTAPGNSTVDRTLDQQCTVTRPGVASLAAALAVELAVSVLQHPKKGAADWSDETVLGAVPHSIRGYLSTFTHILPSTPAFESCVACSDKVLSAYEKDGRLFLRNVFESNAFLENLTGIAELLNDPNIDEIVELDDEEDF